MSHRQTAIGLALLALCALLPGLGAIDLWNPDEPRYGEVAREMTETGNYLVPHLSGRVYAEKPPLFFWSIALMGKTLGSLDEVAVRLPSVLAGVGSTVLVYLLAAIYFQRRAALFSGLVYLSCTKVLWQGRTGQIDMLLGFWVVLALYLWACGRPPKSRRRSFPWGFWVVAGLATLTKGPVGLLPPLLLVLLVAFWERDRTEVRRLRLGWGLLLWFGVVLLWLAPAVVAGGQSYFDVIVLKQNATRYANPWGHFRPWYYYATVLPADFFPWFLLLPGAFLAGRRSFFGEERQGFRLCLAWILVTLVFFSLSPGKRSVYVLQMYPAMAILVGSGVDAWIREWRVSKVWFTLPGAALGAALVVAAFLAPARLAGVPEAHIYPRLAVAAPWCVAGLGALLLLSSVLFGSRRGAGAIAVLAVGMIGLFLFVVHWALPQIDPLKSGRAIGEQAALLVSEDQPIGMFPGVEAGILFYAERNAEILCSDQELRAFVERPDSLLLADLQSLRRIRPPLSLVEVYRDLNSEGFGLFRAGDSEWFATSADRGIPALDLPAVKYAYPCTP